MHHVLLVLVLLLVNILQVSIWNKPISLEVLFVLDNLAESIIKVAISDVGVVASVVNILSDGIFVSVFKQ